MGSGGRSSRRAAARAPPSRRLCRTCRRRRCSWSTRIFRPSRRVTCWRCSARSRLTGSPSRRHRTARPTRSAWARPGSSSRSTGPAARRDFSRWRRRGSSRFRNSPPTVAPLATWNARETIERLGGEPWSQPGARALGLHLVRTEARRRGEPLSRVTERIARAVGLELALLPATDDRLRTRIRTRSGEFEFQEWFVARGHTDRVDEVVYDGAADASPAPGVLEALEGAELIAIAPSNPFVSIGPILAVDEIRAAVERRRERVVAVSPLIGGRAVKGPAEAMFQTLAGGTGADQVTDCYKGLIGALVIDEADADDAAAVAERGVRPLVTPPLVAQPGPTAPLL